MIDIRMALELALQQLDGKNPDSRLEAEILLCHVLNKNRAYIFAHPEKSLNPIQLEHFSQLVLRRTKGEPLAYITGNREFWSLSLKVNPSTLIPRHETERLVELALELIPNQPNTYLLDLGTGSGAISLALAKERPNWHIDACDFSHEALTVARENAQTNGIENVHFYQSDWFKSLPQKRYHAIISNPPYIDKDDPHLSQGDLRFEPQNALVSGQEGFADLQYIIEHSPDYLLPGGLLLLEHGFEQKVRIRSILKKLGYINVQCWQDIQGHDRVSGGWLSHRSEG